MIETRTNLTKLQNRYLLALLILVTFLFGIFYSIHLLIQTQHDDATLINVAGKQRMLSQRTALYTLKLFQDDKEAISVVKHTLMNDLSELEASHHDLIFGNDERGLPGIQTDAVADIYFSAPDQLNLKMIHYLEHVKSIVNAFVQGEEVDRLTVKTAIKESTDDLLFILDKAVKQYEAESANRSLRIELLVFLLLGLTLAVLLMAVIMIFNPIVKGMQHNDEKLARKKSQYETFLRVSMKSPLPTVLMSCEGEVRFSNNAARVNFPDIEKQGLGHDIFVGLEPFLHTLKKTEIEKLMKKREIYFHGKRYEQILSAISMDGQIGVVSYISELPVAETVSTVKSFRLNKAQNNSPQKIKARR